MIVDRHVARRIVDGEITQRRLPRHLRAPKPGAIMPVARAWADDVAGHVMVTSCQLSRRVLGDHDSPVVGHGDTLAGPALKALGYDDQIEYIRDWLLERDTAWLAKHNGITPQATTYNDALYALGELVDQAVLNRWHDRWSYLPVWCVEWQPHDARPRLLALPGRLRFKKVPKGNWVIDDHADPDADLGYTTRADRALPREPEAIDIAELNPGWARAAARRHAEARGGRDVGSDLARRLRA